MTHRFRRALSWLIVSSGSAVILWLVVRGLDELSAVLRDMMWGSFFISIAVGIAGTAVVSGVFRCFLGKYGLVVSAADAQKLVFYGQIAKYVPGKVWPILYQANSLDGISGRALKGITVANIDLMLLSLVSSAVLGIALLIYPYHPVSSWAVVAIGLALSVYVGRKCLISDVIRWLLFKTGLRWNKLEINCTNARLDLSLLLFCIALYVLPLVAYFLMLDAVFHLTSAERNTVTAYLLLAWTVSTLTLIVPAGLGVKEMVFVGLGTLGYLDVSTERLVAIAVVSRFWQVLQDLGGGAAVFFIMRLKVR